MWVYKVANRTIHVSANGIILRRLPFADFSFVENLGADHFINRGMHLVS